MTTNEIIEKVGGIGPSVILIAFCLNAGLSALSLILDKIKDLTTSEVDNKAAEIIKAIVVGLQKITDFLSANISHKK